MASRLNWLYLILLLRTRHSWTMFAIHTIVHHHNSRNVPIMRAICISNNLDINSITITQKSVLLFYPQQHLIRRTTAVQLYSLESKSCKYYINRFSNILILSINLLISVMNPVCATWWRFLWFRISTKMSGWGVVG